ncbi:MAG TPA: YbdK family carboxylate-amine ligase [Solirubrobacteraceae bacterium]
MSGDLSGVPWPANTRAAFDVDAPMTVGLEEELMVLDAATLDLAPRAAELLDRAGGDPRFKPELPAAQLEIVAPPARTVGEAAAALAEARIALSALAGEDTLLAGAGAHPFAALEGVLSTGARYEAIARRYGSIARRQLVFGLHVHAAVRPADRALAVYNALRSYLPLLAALAANAPFHGGRDTGLASVRPTLCSLLPRQGVPPPIASFEQLDEALDWGERAGAMLVRSQWWWEARLHPGFGTVEVRVPDTQTTVGETAAIAAVVHALVTWLAERYAAGEELPVAPSWRIAENRSSACREGLEGTMADLVTGEVRPTRAWAAELLDDLAEAAQRAGCGAELAAARDGLGANGASRQREVAARRGSLTALTSWLAGRFLG